MSTLIQGASPLQQMKRLMSRLCDEMISVAEQDQLRELIRGHSECLTYYIEYMHLHGMLCREATVDVCLGTPQYQSQFERTLKTMKRRVAIQNALIKTSVVSVLVLILGLTVYVKTLPLHDPIARINNLSAEVPESEHWLQEEYVKRNTPYVLNAGIVSLEFDSGTQVTIKGPAVFIPRGLQMIELLSGELSAYVPDPKKQFRVRTAEFDVVDLGTGFMVRVEQGESDVHVFSGNVSIFPTPSHHFPAKTLRRGQAVKIDRQTMVMDEIESSPFLSDTWMAQLESFKISSTGQFVEVGQDDPFWIVKTVEGVTLPAKVVNHLAAYKENRIDESQWLSVYLKNRPITGDPLGPGEIQDGTLHTYQLAFILQDVDPLTAKIIGRFWSDSKVTAIRINGLDITVSLPEISEYLQGTALLITEGFVLGENLLEFDVLNGSIDIQTGKFNDMKTFMAFRAQLEGSIHFKYQEK